jgi:hypothetical protein
VGCVRDGLSSPYLRYGHALTPVYQMPVNSPHFTTYGTGSGARKSRSRETTVIYQLAQTIAV